MGTYVAWVSWADDGGFADGRYSRGHELRFDGGAVVRGSSSPDIVPLPFSDPAGIDPEEALVSAVSACHMLWFLSLAQQNGHVVASYRDRAEGRIGRIGPGRHAITEIVLRPDIAFSGPVPDQAGLDALHHQAHERCFIANSLKAEIRVEAPLSGGNALQADPLKEQKEKAMSDQPKGEADKAGSTPATPPSLDPSAGEDAQPGTGPDALEAGFPDMTRGLASGAPTPEDADWAIADAAGAASGAALSGG